MYAKKGRTMRRQKLQDGFTLIELMITVVIIAILASIAWPSYTEYLKRSRRSDAQQVLLAIANKQQQYMLDARTYTDVLGSAGLNITQQGWDCSVNSGKTCANGYYDVTATPGAGPPPTFAISGVPKTASAQNGDGTLNYASTGSKSRMVGGVDKGW